MMYKLANQSCVRQWQWMTDLCNKTINRQKWTMPTTKHVLIEGLKCHEDHSLGAPSKCSHGHSDILMEVIFTQGNWPMLQQEWYSIYWNIYSTCYKQHAQCFFLIQLVNQSLIRYLTCALRRPFKTRNFIFNSRLADVLTRIPFFESFAGSHVNMPLVAVDKCGMTCIHATVSRSPREQASVPPDKRHCRQWMSSLFCGFLPNPLSMTYSVEVPATKL